MMIKPASMVFPSPTSSARTCPKRFPETTRSSKTHFDGKGRISQETEGVSRLFPNRAHDSALFGLRLRQ